jgi:hypothetical protein
MNKKLKVEQLLTIPIQELCYSGSWIRKIGNTKIELRHTAEGIVLFVDEMKEPVRWAVYERTIRGDISHRGGYIPQGKAWVYYVYGSDGRRYKYLNMLTLPDQRFRIGTRRDFGAVYTRDCYSKRQRKIYLESRLVRLTAQQRRKRRMRQDATRIFH